MSTRPLFLPFLFVFAIACSSPLGSEEVVLVTQNKADGDGVPPMFVCNIELGEGADDFFRRDTLRCEQPAEHPLSVEVAVWNKDGEFLSSLSLSDGPASVAFAADQYPLSLKAEAYVRREDGALFGMQGVTLRAEFAVARAEDLQQSQGPALPFGIWELEFVGRTNFAELKLDAYTIAPGTAGIRFERGGEPLSDVLIDASVRVRAGESTRVFVAVPEASFSLAGTANFELGAGTAEQAFELDGSGTYFVSADGVDRGEGEPSISSQEIVSCDPTEGTFSCRLIVREGIEVGDALLTPKNAGGSLGEFTLPTDGSSIALPAGSTSVAARVAISRGISGIDLAEFGVIEGELALENDSVELELPFSLLDVQVRLQGVTAATFKAGSHLVRLSRAVGGLFESESELRFLVREPSHVWIAVSAGATSVSGELVVLVEGGGNVVFADTALTAGSHVISEEGLHAPRDAESGLEIARCWVTTDIKLRCLATESAGVSSPTLKMHMEPVNYENEFPLYPGDNEIAPLTSDIVPVSLTLSAQLENGERVETRTVRLVDPLAELPESAPLILTTN